MIFTMTYFYHSDLLTLQNVQAVHSVKPKRKAMVTAIWKREFNTKSVRLEHNKPDKFVRCQVSHFISVLTRVYPKVSRLSQ